MFGIGSRCFYAKWKDIIFEFAYKRDRDYFIDNSDAEYISSLDAYKQYPKDGFVQVYPSCMIGANPDRKKRIKEWYENKRC